MSSEPRSREEPRGLATAREDVRRTHATLQALVRRFPDGAWEREVLDGWTAAEVAFHLVLTCERALAGLRDAAAAGPAPRTRAGLWRTVDRWRTLLTWRPPPGRLIEPGDWPQGAILTHDQLAARATRWAADYCTFLENLEAPFLKKLTFEQRALGPLDPCQWARFLRIYTRHFDLRLGKTRD